MAKIIETVVREASNIQDAPSVHGTKIGLIYAGQSLQVVIEDPESPHDGWVTIVGPKPDPVKIDGTWKATGKIGWIEYAHLSPIAPNEHEYKLIVDAVTGAVKSCVMVR